jgi:uncharacterized damage-inducible protein DinB
MADSIRTVRRNTILIAEDIREEDYRLRPTSDSRSVSEILTHILFFSFFDRAFHGKKYLTAAGAFDLEKFVKELQSEEKTNPFEARTRQFLEGIGRKLGALGGRPSGGGLVRTSCTALAEAQKRSLK